MLIVSLRHCHKTSGTPFVSTVERIYTDQKAFLFFKPVSENFQKNKYSKLYKNSRTLAFSANKKGNYF